MTRGWREHLSGIQMLMSPEGRTRTQDIQPQGYSWQPSSKHFLLNIGQNNRDMELLSPTIFPLGEKC